VTSNFAEGVSVQVMQIAMPWVGPIMQNYAPEDDPTPKESADEEHPVRCPKCHSTEVVFDRLTSSTDGTDAACEKFEWTCDSCGHTWQDDGVAKEV
jgi:DNA-directed RNA polymerase subunit M/transcription elongation factor TFIIS